MLAALLLNLPTPSGGYPSDGYITPEKKKRRAAEKLRMVGLAELPNILPRAAQQEVVCDIEIAPTVVKKVVISSDDDDITAILLLMD